VSEEGAKILAVRSEISLREIVGGISPLPFLFSSHFFSFLYLRVPLHPLGNAENIQFLEMNLALIVEVRLWQEYASNQFDKINSWNSRVSFVSNAVVIWTYQKRSYDDPPIPYLFGTLLRPIPSPSLGSPVQFGGL
jgi:hypothetical protein